MQPSEITQADIDALLRFLPLFRRPGVEYILHWAGGEPTADGAITMPYPVYAEEALAFFALAGKSCWCDFEYVPSKARAMLEDDAQVANATLAQVKTMLTYCVRGERFCDGFWGELLRSGKIVKLLERLAAIERAGNP